MPNWVYTSMSVAGKREDLLAFAEKAKRPHTTLWLTEEWVYDEKLEKRVQVPADQRKIEPKEETPDAISFWNFLAPSEEELPYYFGHKTKPEDEISPDAPLEEKMAKAMTFSGDDWYNWNVRNWGTKWDAGSDELDTDLAKLDDKLNNTLSYRFETAWSPAEGAFRAMVEQHPELSFEFYCEEEQGWGVIFSGEEGHLSTTKEWDIPNSHADYVDLDRVDSCSCAFEDDPDDWYSDCPRPEQDFYVVITKTYRVRTNTAENAWELAEQNLEIFDDHAELIEDDTHIEVRGEDGERLYPTLNDGEPKKAKECSHHFVPAYKLTDSGKEFLGKESCVFCHSEHPLDTDPQNAKV